MIKIEMFVAELRTSLRELQNDSGDGVASTDPAALEQYTQRITILEMLVSKHSMVAAEDSVGSALNALTPNKSPLPTKQQHVEELAEEVHRQAVAERQELLRPVSEDCNFSRSAQALAQIQELQDPDPLPVAPYCTPEADNHANSNSELSQRKSTS